MCCTTNALHRATFQVSNSEGEVNKVSFEYFITSFREKQLSIQELKKRTWQEPQNTHVVGRQNYDSMIKHSSSATSLRGRDPRSILLKLQLQAQACWWKWKWKPVLSSRPKKLRYNEVGTRNPNDRAMSIQRNGYLRITNRHHHHHQVSLKKGNLRAL